MQIIFNRLFSAIFKTLDLSLGSYSSCNLVSEEKKRQPSLFFSLLKHVFSNVAITATLLTRSHRSHISEGATPKKRGWGLFFSTPSRTRTGAHGQQMVESMPQRDWNPPEISRRSTKSNLALGIALPHSVRYPATSVDRRWIVGRTLAADSSCGSIRNMLTHKSTAWMSVHTDSINMQGGA